MATALLIIDMQRALCTGEEAAFDIDGVLQRINAISTRARVAGIPVAFIQHEDGEGSLVHGTEGWQLADGLLVDPADLRIRKTTPDSFHGTNLQQLLQERGVDQLVVCGLQSDFCIDASVRRALALGYPVTLVADGHSTVANRGRSAAEITAERNRTLAAMAGPGARIAVKPAQAVSLR
ncbi:MAG: cysteine hydrolase family protein [Ramlibacter sp.]